MTTTIIGFPRIGEHRDLKFATEHYWKQQTTQAELQQTAAELRAKHWTAQQAAGIDLIPVGDFSYFDGTLDTAFLLNIVPQRYRALGLSPLDEYFSLARGYQQDGHSVKALPMKKWFNTNYHYIVPEFDDQTDLKLVGDQLFNAIDEAHAQGIHAKAVLTGPYTLLKLGRYVGHKQAADFVTATIQAYRAIFDRLAAQQVEWVQLDEPALCFDVTPEDQALFDTLYDGILPHKHALKVLLQTYFGDIRDVYTDVIAKPFDGIGLDFLEGQQTEHLITKYGFPTDKTLFAGVINGKNIWRNHYQATLDLLDRLANIDHLVLSTSCSLLHVPYTAANETQLPDDVHQHLAFAIEKLAELNDLDHILAGDNTPLEANDRLFATIKHPQNPAVTAREAALTEADYTRLPARQEREVIQQAEFDLPPLPTTTIGSFSQSKDVRQNRSKFRKGEISKAEYDAFNQQKIKEIVAFQEDIGLDVLVHGEYERNDMVEYFGEKLDGFLFTQNGWVQSYGTRGVKPPIIWGDISRTSAMTVAASVYAQSLTNKPMKGMITGPVTIFNWSFPREDISPEESVTQIALAMQDEVLDLEAHGIKIIQIDEPALRENLPLRKTDWYTKYLNWAVPAFRLTHSQVAADTQIHTHMCYSEFGDIIGAIDALDADVISFEASRADLSLIDQLVAADFQTEVGPGVYDIHSPRIPSEEEIVTIIDKIIAKLPVKKVWINPDCGLKTRSETEVAESLKHMVAATRKVRSQLYETNRAL